MVSVGRNIWMTKRIFGTNSISLTKQIIVPGNRERGTKGYLALTHLPEFDSYHGGTAVKHKHHILG